MKTKLTQKQKVLKHLKRYKTITTMKCFDLYKITRLSEYIRRLRKEGHNIPAVKWSVNPKTKTRYGTYRLCDTLLK